VAAVSGTGLVTGLGVGAVTITATSDGQSGMAAATVTNVPVASVDAEPGDCEPHGGRDDSVDGHSEGRERHRAQWSGRDVGDEQCGCRDSQRERIGYGRRGRLGHDHRDE